MSLPPFIGGICSATCLRNLGAELLRADLYSAAAMHRFQQSVVLELLRLAMERAMPLLFFSLFFFTVVVVATNTKVEERVRMRQVMAARS